MDSLKVIPFAFAAMYVAIFAAVAYLVTAVVSMSQGAQIAVWVIAGALSVFVLVIAAVLAKIWTEDERKRERFSHSLFSEQ